jgi:hypothetical protein
VTERNVSVNGLKIGKRGVRSKSGYVSKRRPSRRLKRLNASVWRKRPHDRLKRLRHKTRWTAVPRRARARLAGVLIRQRRRVGPENSPQLTLQQSLAIRRVPRKARLRRLVRLIPLLPRPLKRADLGRPKDRKKRNRLLFHLHLMSSRPQSLMRRRKILVNPVPHPGILRNPIRSRQAW